MHWWSPVEISPRIRHPSTTAIIGRLSQECFLCILTRWHGSAFKSTRLPWSVCPRVWIVHAAFKWSGLEVFSNPTPSLRAQGFHGIYANTSCPRKRVRVIRNSELSRTNLQCQFLQVWLTLSWSQNLQIELYSSGSTWSTNTDPILTTRLGYRRKVPDTSHRARLI